MQSDLFNKNWVSLKRPKMLSTVWLGILFQPRHPVKCKSQWNLMLKPRQRRCRSRGPGMWSPIKRLYKRCWERIKGPRRVNEKRGSKVVRLLGVYSNVYSIFHHLSSQFFVWNRICVLHTIPVHIGILLKTHNDCFESISCFFRLCVWWKIKYHHRK